MFPARTGRTRLLAPPSHSRAQARSRWPSLRGSSLARRRALSGWPPWSVGRLAQCEDVTAGSISASPTHASARRPQGNRVFCKETPGAVAPGNQHRDHADVAPEKRPSARRLATSAQVRSGTLHITVHCRGRRAATAGPNGADGLSVGVGDSLHANADPTAPSRSTLPRTETTEAVLEGSHPGTDLPALAIAHS